MPESDSYFINFLETLSNIVSVLSPQRSFQASLSKILKILENCHPFVRPHIFIYDPEIASLRICMGGTEPIVTDTIYEPGVGITGQVFILGQSVIVERISKSKVFTNKTYIRTKQEMDNLAFLCVPIYVPATDGFETTMVLGTLNADIPIIKLSKREECCKFLEVIAALIGSQLAYFQEEIIRKSRENLLELEQDNLCFDMSGHIVHVSKKMKYVLQFALSAASQRSNVLLYGQVGTGKELIATYIHSNSERRTMPLKKINCATLNADTIEQDFFGVQKNADQYIMQTNKGFLEVANHGTIFLDGIDFLPKKIQASLLHVFGTQELTRVGGSKSIPVNVRFICSSLKTPAEMLTNNFISDEFLQVFLGISIFMPPLSERKEDIIPLAEFFVHESIRDKNKKVHAISAEVAELILKYDWQNNVGELKYCIESAISQCKTDTLNVQDFPPAFQDTVHSSSAVSFTNAVEYYEQKLITDALVKTKGNMFEAAHMLSASYRIINYKVKKYGIQFKKYI